MIDNGTEYRTVGHVFQSDYSGNRGRDKCLEMFGEQDEECVRFNTTYESNLKQKEEEVR